MSESEGREEKFVYPSAIGPSLTVSELFLFCDVCELLRTGLLLPAIAERLTARYKLKVSYKRCARVLNKVARALFGPSGTWGQLRLTTPGSAGDTFCQRVAFFLATLKRPDGERPDARANRVVVHGSDFCVLWVLPGVLAESGLLGTDLDLEIRRGSFRKYMSHLRSGATDLALGPKAPPFDEFESTRLLAVPRVLIYPAGHRFACGKPAAQVTLADLGDETVFRLESAAVPEVRMNSYFPVPPRQCVVVDSVSHIYRYVARGLGVSLGYHPVFVPDDAHPGVSSVPLRGPDAARVGPAEFFLYSFKGRPLPDPARRVVQAIRDWAEKKMEVIRQLEDAASSV
jgi:DNA-binding transcriptional LysR family regulator